MNGCNCSRCQEYHLKVVNNPEKVFLRRNMNQIIDNRAKRNIPVFRAEFVDGKLHIS